MVVVTYNAGDWVRRSLAAAREAETALATELIVIDNASSDFTETELRGWAGPDAAVHRLPENVGFGRACNRAAEIANGRYVLLLNPDAILSDLAIDHLVELHQRRERIGIVGGRVTAPDGSLDRGSCWGFQTTWSLLCFALGLSTAFSRSAVLNPEGLGAWDRDSERRVDVVTGCLLLADLGLWKQLGGFDEDYFMYGEDADLCHRANALGYESWITPKAHVVHALGASSSSNLRKQQLLFRGKATLVRKTAPSKAARRWQLVLLQLGVGVRAIGENVTRTDRAAWRGLWRSRRDWTQGWAPANTSPSTKEA